MNRAQRQKQWNDLKRLHASRREAIRRRLDEFRSVRPDQYFYELVYCILTPQTSADHAGNVVEQLQKLDFHSNSFDPEPILRDPKCYIRFHRTKRKHLLNLKEVFPTVLHALQSIDAPSDCREWLVANVLGLCYKEATHVLRNVGRSGGLAILDRHILRNLHRFGAIRSLPSSLSRRRYLLLERAFMRFSERIGIPLDELDLLFWSMETGVIRK